MGQRSIDAHADDLATLTHESSHAVIAVVLGRKLIRVIGHRHYARADDEAGSVEWLRDPDDPFGDAVVCLAGRIAVEGIHAAGDTFDERKARKLLPVDVDFNRARAEAWIVLQRRDVCAAITALAHAIAANGYVMNGPAVEQVVRAVLGSDQEVSAH